MTFSKAVFFFSLSFILGVFFAPVSLFFGLLSVFSFYCLSRRLVVAVFCMVFFLFGAFSFHSFLYNIPSSVESPVYGVVKEEPVLRDNSTRVVFEHEEGRALLYTEYYADYRYGDVLKTKGDFVKPEPEEYANYLKKEGIYHLSFFPEIEKKGSKGSAFYRALFSLKEMGRRNLQRSIPPPQLFLSEAMVLGERDSFTQDFSEKLSITGTRHITAISGMHIVIISAMLFYLFLFFNLKKRWAALFSLFFIFLFIFFVGVPASALRAGIMGGALLLSNVFYRKTDTFRLLSMAAAVMLVFNPLLLHYDLGFQLSFLAVLGIIFLHRPAKNLLCGIRFPETRLPEQRRFVEMINRFFGKNERIADLVAVTLGAQIFVFPLILYNFGHVSLVSVPANVLIVPLLPFIMVFGFLTALTGFVLFSFPLYLFLSFVLFVVDIFYVFPFSAVFIENVPFSFIFLFYALLFYKIYALQSRNPQ